jgi:hypothetical protein
MTKVSRQEAAPMRQRLVYPGLVVFLSLVTGPTGCRPPVGALSSIGRAGAIGSRGAASLGGGAARFATTLRPAGSLGARTAIRTGVKTYGRVVTPVGDAQIDAIVGRRTATYPKSPFGGAAGLDPAFESNIALSAGSLNAEDASAALNPGISKNGASASGSSTVPGKGSIASLIIPDSSGPPVSARAGVPLKAAPRAPGQMQSHPPELRLGLHELELIHEGRVQSEAIPDLARKVEAGRWDEAARLADRLSADGGLSPEAKAAVEEVVKLSRQASALSAAEAALKQSPQRLADALVRVPTGSMSEGLRNAVRRRMAVADIKEAVAGRGDWRVNLARLKSDLLVLKSDPDTIAFGDVVANDLVIRYGGLIHDGPTLGGSTRAGTRSLRDMNLIGVLGDFDESLPAQRVPAAGATTTTGPVGSKTLTRPQIPEVSAPGYRPPHRDPALADLPPLAGAEIRKAHLVSLDDYETKVETQLRRELGRERDSVASHASHLARHMVQPHDDRRDRHE